MTVLATGILFGTACALAVIAFCVVMLLFVAFMGLLMSWF